MAPTDVGLGVFEFLLLFLALAHFKVVELGAQTLPSDVAVAVLAAAVLALHHDAGGHVRQAHGRVGFVDVLTARTAGAVGVGAHIGGVDVDLDRVVDLGVDEQRGERGVATARGIEGALAHQAVHTGFGAQEAIGVLALDLDGRALDARGVARGFFFYGGFEAFALGVADVLAQQHAGPVASLGAARAGLDVDKTVQRVGRVVEHAAELELLHLGGHGLCFTLDGDQAVFVAVGKRHLEQLAVVGQLTRQAVQDKDHVFQRLFLFAQLLGALGVVPDRGVFQRRFDFL